jgi:prepilin-type N-terminal cleavage/methylation domain-containing protein
MHRTHSGFTIVELVVVIILLGILAATALPRFINIEDEAHGAAFEAVSGSLQTGIALFHAKAVATQAGVSTVPGGAANDDFSGLLVNANGFPYGTTVNVSGTIEAVADCAAVFTNVQQAGAPTVTTAAASDAVDTAPAADYTAVVNVPNCQYYHSGNSKTVNDVIGMLTYDSVTGQVTAGTYTVD